MKDLLECATPQQRFAVIEFSSEQYRQVQTRVRLLVH